ncbi:MAG: VacJ family lipoprotein [Thiohalomonadales bacterium]
MKTTKLFIICTVSYFTVACATVEGPPDPRDPFESYNRPMHSFNTNMDDYVFAPVARAYREYVPHVVSKSVSNIFSNFDDVVVVFNDILQFKFTQALSDTARIVFNTTIGVFGLFDIATHLDMPKHNEDFGQTLGYWGISPGPYVVWPFFGPRSVRDSVGLGVDFYSNPVVRRFPPRVTNTSIVLGMIDARAGFLLASDVLEKAAPEDVYSFTRDAYLQRRQYYVYDGDPPDEDDDEDEDDEEL